MCFSIGICEFPMAISNITIIGGKLYFVSSHHLYSTDNGVNYSVVYKDKKLLTFVFAINGLWLIRDQDLLSSDEKKAIFFDIFDTGISYPGLDYLPDNNSFIDDICICTYKVTRRERCLVIQNINSCEIKKRKGHFFDFVTDGFYIYTREHKNDRDLYCFDLDLNEKWHVSFPSNLGRFNLYNDKPFLYNKYIILYVGVEKKTRKDGLLCAYSKEDGTEIWCKQINDDPDFSCLIDGRYYMNSKGQMLVVNPDTGETITDEPSGFKDEILIFPYKEKLIVICKSERCIRVFSNNGKTMIQDIPIPEPYQPIIYDLPVVHDDNIYIILVRLLDMYNVSSYGLLKLTPTVGEPTIEVKERPPIFMITEEENKKTSYTLITSHNDLEEITRHLQIRLQEIMMLYGDQGGMSTEKIDLNHTGKIYIFVDPTELPDNTQDEIRLMVDEVIEWAEGINLHPGAGKKYKFQIDVSMEIPK